MIGKIICKIRGHDFSIKFIHFSLCKRCNEFKCNHISTYNEKIKECGNGCYSTICILCGFEQT